jgi:hypothetical protein
LLAILFVVVLGMDGYKVNPASVAKKLYNGNGALDLFMRRVSPGRRFVQELESWASTRWWNCLRFKCFLAGGISERDLIHEALKFPPKLPSLVFLQKR